MFQSLNQSQVASYGRYIMADILSNIASKIHVSLQLADKEIAAQTNS